VNLRFPILLIEDVMLRLSVIAFALPLLATIDAVAQQQCPAPAKNAARPSITLEQAITMARANEPAFTEIAREDGTVRYQLALTNLKLLTGAI
jgi:hypothetical protein